MSRTAPRLSLFAVAALARAPMATPERWSYHPGSIERPWLSGNVTGSICNLASRPAQRAGAKLWMDYTAAAKSRTSASKAAHASIADPSAIVLPHDPLQPSDAQAAALSRFSKRTAGKEVMAEYIEPLTGIARSPLSLQAHGCDEIAGATFKVDEPFQSTDFKRHGQRPESVNREMARVHGRIFDLFRTDYLIVKNGCRQPPAAATARNRFYDLGCSVFRESLREFTQMYEGQCITFDDLYGWEFIEHSPRKWWAEVPISLASRLHLYNVPVSQAATMGAPVGDFLTFLNATASRDDFVVVKLYPSRSLEARERAACRPPAHCALFDSQWAATSTTRRSSCT